MMEDVDQAVPGLGVLPEAVHGTLAGAVIVDALAREGDAASGLPDEVGYAAFETEDRRFAWLHDPATIGEEPHFLCLELRGSDEDWQVIDADPYDSPEDAMQAAGRGWLTARGGPDAPPGPVTDW